MKISKEKQISAKGGVSVSRNYQTNNDPPLGTGTSATPIGGVSLSTFRDRYHPRKLVGGREVGK